MLLSLIVLACAPSTPTDPAPSPGPAPAPAAPVVVVDGPETLAAVLDAPMERGACRDGRIRRDGQVVADARDATHAAWLADLIDPETPARSAIAMGTLFDAKVALEPRFATPIAESLVALHRTEADALQVLHCRKLKGVRGEGIAWNARGDALVLLTRFEDGVGREAFEKAATDLPSLVQPGRAAFGDEDALHTVSKLCLKQLCEGRTWETSWMLRTLDTGRHRGALLPLGQMQTGACELLANGADPNVVTPRQ